MQIFVRYDRNVDAWLVRSEDVRLRTALDVEEWRAAMMAAFAPLGGGKGHLLVDIDGLDIDIAVKEIYGAAEKEICDRFALSVTRFGRPEGFTNTVILLESAKRQFPANLHSSRTAAVSALKQLRSRKGREAANSPEFWWP